MSSARLDTYIKTLERLPAITEADDVGQILRAAGLPLFEPVVQFHCDYAGLIQPNGLELFIWGLFHEEVHPYADFLPNLPAYELDASGRHDFSCCNCHGSDSWTIDEAGALYWCTYPVATSFEKKLERDAVVWELNNLDEPIFRVRFEQPISEILPQLVPRLTEGLIPEASDKIESVYRLQNLYTTVEEDTLRCTIIGDDSSALLHGFAYRAEEVGGQKPDKPSSITARLRKLFRLFT